MKEEIKIFLKGLLMGIADIIPGISGGTIAFITGIYERLIRGIANLNIKFLIYFIKGDIKRAKEYFNKIDFSLFIPLSFGISLSFLLMSNIIHYLLNYYSSLTYSFFIGLILASITLLFKEIKEFNLKSFLLFIIGFILAFIISGGNKILLSHSLPSLFFSGFLASCAMILPGISGSYILLFLSQYEYVISLIKNLDIFKLFIFSIGAFLGLFTFSKILSYAFERYRDYILLFLVGVMLGALRFPISKIYNNFETINLLLIIFGIILVLFLERLAKNKAPKSYNQ
ncbi:DUF368 domain-containing protein [Methanocaldococcus sp.]